MNGVVYVDPRTMRASLTDEGQGGMAYVPVSKCVMQDRELDFACEMLVGFAEKGTCDMLMRKKYRWYWIIACVACVLYIGDFAVLDGNVVLGYILAGLWIVASAVVYVCYEYQAWLVVESGKNKEQRKKMVEAMKEAVKGRKEKPFEEG